MPNKEAGQVQVRISKRLKPRLTRIAEKAGTSERFVLDLLIEHHADAVAAMLTTPVRVEPRAATGGR